MAPCQKGGMRLTGVSLDLVQFDISINVPDDGRGEMFIRSAEGSPQERLPALWRTRKQIQTRLETQ